MLRYCHVVEVCSRDNSSCTTAPLILILDYWSTRGSPWKNPWDTLPNAITMQSRCSHDAVTTTRKCLSHMGTNCIHISYLTCQELMRDKEERKRRGGRGTHKHSKPGQGPRLQAHHRKGWRKRHSKQCRVGKMRNIGIPVTLVTTSRAAVFAS